jgi:hypothetical protein
MIFKNTFPAVTEELVGIRRRRTEATQVLFRAIKTTDTCPYEKAKTEY